MTIKTMSTTTVKSALFSLALSLIALTPAAHADMSAFGGTWMPLAGLDEDDISIHRVPYINHQAGSGIPNGFDVVDEVFMAPTNGKEAQENMNLASLAGIQVSSEEIQDLPQKLRVTIDTTAMNAGEVKGYQPLEVFKATLECIRLLSEGIKIEVVLKANPTGQEAFMQSLARYKKHPYDEPFYEQISEQ